MAGIILTPKDKRVLQELIRREKRQRGSIARPGPLELSHPQSPEVFVALTPSGGIPALTESTDTGTAFGALDAPGSAECQVYRLDESELLEAVDGLTHVVYNLSSESIPGNKWILVIRDKFGTWFSNKFLSGGASQHPAWNGYLSTNQVIINNANTTVSNWTDDRDTYNLLEATRAAIDRTGWYHVSTTLMWEANGNGYREARLETNTTFFQTDRKLPMPAGINTFHAISGVLYVEAGGYIRVSAKQTSGGNLELIQGLEQTNFQGAFISDST